jgi:glycosyltransferase involved in cell wall biosynthesis
MRITYVTEDTELWGGIGVVFQHLEMLAAAGHDVFLTTPTSGPDWYPLKVPIYTIKSIEPSLIPDADIIVIASWRIVKEIIESKKGIPVYLCQGYEASLKELAAFKSKIDEVYTMGLPVLTVSRHLGNLIKERFNAETYYIGQMVNRKIFYPQRNPLKRLFRHSGRPSRLLVVGPFEGSYKNIPTILRGVALANKSLKKPLDVIRISQLPLSREEEQIIKPAEYHYRVSYHRMGYIYRSSDMLISLSTEAEGFGLPVLEAMACGVPTILSRIPSHLDFDHPLDYALFVDSQPEALSEAIQNMCENASLRLRLLDRGLAVAEKFTSEALLTRLINAFGDIISRKCKEQGMSTDELNLL